MKHVTLAVALACTLGVAGLAFTQNQDRMQRQSPQEQSTQVSGTIESQRTLQPQGSQERHVVVRVQPDDARSGEFRFVDLGPQRDLEEQGLQIEPGAEVSVTGQPGQISGRSVLVAERVTMDGQRYSLNQSSRQQMSRSEQQRSQLYRSPSSMSQQRQSQSAQQQARQGQSQEISGTLESQSSMTPQGEQEQHVVLRVRPDQPGARLTMIDLGSQRDVQEQNIEIARGAEITASGQMDEINGRPVLVADEITIDGEQYALDQTSRQQARQGQTMRQQGQMQQRQPQQGQRAQSQRMQQSGQSRLFESGQGQLPVLRGEVVSLRDFSIDGIKEKHRLIKVSDARNQDRTWVVDLGPSNALQQLDLQEGDRVLVQGQPGRIDGRPVLRAVQIAEVVELTESMRALREGSQQTGQQSRQIQEQRSQQQRSQPDIDREREEQGQEESMRSQIGKPKTGSDNTPSTSPQSDR